MGRAKRTHTTNVLHFSSCCHPHHGSSESRGLLKTFSVCPRGQRRIKEKLKIGVVPQLIPHSTITLACSRHSRAYETLNRRMAGALTPATPHACKPLRHKVHPLAAAGVSAYWERLVLITSRGGQAILMPSTSARPSRSHFSLLKHASGSFTRTTVSPSPLPKPAPDRWIKIHGGGLGLPPSRACFAFWGHV